MLKKLILSMLLSFVLTISTANANEDVMLKCQDKHPEWYSCTTDEDCTVSLDPCGWPVLGVTKWHKGRSEICTRQAGAFIDCPMWRDTPENKMAAVCQEGVCTGIKASEVKPKPQPVQPKE